MHAFMIFNHNDNGIAIIILSKIKSLDRKLPSYAGGLGDYAAVDMKAQAFGHTIQLILLAYVPRGNGILRTLVSNAPWIPANFDQVLVISDKCTAKEVSKGNRFWN